MVSLDSYSQSYLVLKGIEYMFGFHVRSDKGNSRGVELIFGVILTYLVPLK